MALCWCSTMTMMSGAYKQPQKGKGMGVGMGMGKGKGKGKGKAQTKQRQSRGSDGIGFGGKRNDPTWQCIQGCGACCKLDKGPSFATPEEIFDDPSDVKLYRSMVGPDGWCIHYEKSTRTCSIYSAFNLRSSIFLSCGAKCFPNIVWNWQEEIQQRGMQFL
ncbi:uncharacterized protein LOC100243090 isoform X2 [Vitis vinifera]|uniref:uncharacterized protein LOC100243090 isoform X2 n=1 Tax=Vitis vinifera TaxID=29760 RepID=UPI0028830D3A|nr:uncharacterized protein LOC100243090 isoform X2 [Vitis vinifera]